jgi:hypothetical protein
MYIRATLQVGYLGTSIKTCVIADRQNPAVSSAQLPHVRTALRFDIKFKRLQTCGTSTNNQFLVHV